MTAYRNTLLIRLTKIIMRKKQKTKTIGFLEIKVIKSAVL